MLSNSIFKYIKFIGHHNCFHLYIKIETLIINWSFEMQSITKFMFYRNVDKAEQVVLPNGIRYIYLIIIAHNLTFEVLNYPHFSCNMHKFWIKYYEVMVVGGGGGCKRKVIIPSSLGFGEKGAKIGPGVQIPAFCNA
jgi:hypothetical protein